MLLPILERSGSQKRGLVYESCRSGGKAGRSFALLEFAAVPCALRTLVRPSQFPTTSWNPQRWHWPSFVDLEVCSHIHCQPTGSCRYSSRTRWMCASNIRKSTNWLFKTSVGYVTVTGAPGRRLLPSTTRAARRMG